MATTASRETADPGVTTGDRLLFTGFMALVLHIFILLSLGFKLPFADKVAPPLNITLATQVAEQAPEKADFLAQQNQAASGDGDSAQELLTDQVAAFNHTDIHDITPPPQEKTLQAARVDQDLVSTEAASQLKAQHDNDDKTPSPEERLAQEEDIAPVSPETSALQAKLDRLRQSEALKPKIKRIQSEATRASLDAAYLYAWNQKVEALGNEQFPEAALRQKIFGTLMMAVTLNRDGSLFEAEIIKPSQHPLLNQTALQLVHLAAPFEPIPKEVLDGHDKLEIIRTWSFEITGLSTH
jgi:periplasmic protein TonB